MHTAAMTLAEYLIDTGESDAAFGARAGLSQPQVSRLKRGVVKPSWDAMDAIARASDGKVAFQDWAPTKVEAAE